jgi:hypothetical protein
MNTTSPKEIPNFDKFGILPPGKYSVSLEMVTRRFGGSKSLRRSQLTKNFREFFNFIKYYALEIYIDGSYTTNKLAPRDIDLIVILPPEFKTNTDAYQKLLVFGASHDVINLHIFQFIRGEEDSAFQDRLNWFTHTRPPNVREKGIIFLEIRKT